MYITQISVYLENNQGALRMLTKLLAENQVDLLALSIADTTNFGITRIIVREKDIDIAIEKLKENGFIAKKNHVLCVAVPNQPSGLDSVLKIIEENKISIEYMYSLNYIIGNKAMMVLRLSCDNMDKDQIASVLEKNDVTLINQEDINKL